MRLETLAETHPNGDRCGHLTRVEEALTDGCTQALALETERLRLGRQIAATTAELEQSRGDRAADELSALVHRLADAEGELFRLRRAIGSLRLRMRELRAA